MKKIFSAGYQNTKNLRTLIKAAKKLDEKMTIVDIRYRAGSRNPEWNKSRMSAEIESAGLRYFHIRELGNTRYNQLDSEIVLENPEQGLGKLYEILKNRPVILLCACWEYNTCHRRNVASLIDIELGQPVIELYGSMIKELTEDQTKMF